MISVFVYGSLKKGFWNNVLLRDSLFVGDDETVSDDFDLRCWGAYPAVYIGGNTTLKGELYSVTEEVFRRLDSLEGYPSFYNRGTFDLKSGARAWLYYIDEKEREGIQCPEGVWPKVQEV